MINNPVLPDQLSQVGTLGVLIGNLVAVGIIIAGIMTFLYLVLGGIEWILSAGDKAGLQQARDRITNALIGLTIVVAAWAIITMASNFLGFPFPKIPIPSLSGSSSTKDCSYCAKVNDWEAQRQCYTLCRGGF